MIYPVLSNHPDAKNLRHCKYKLKGLDLLCQRFISYLQMEF